MAEVQRRVRENDSSRPAIHLTFDDGYSDNCEQAIPEVIRRGIPCTYFVTLENVLSGQPFEHDLRRGVPIPPNTLEQLRWMSRQGIEIGAHTRNHRDMGLVTPENISNEISDCANELSGLICQPIRYFAFPYGLAENMPPAAIADVISAGMQGFCSAFGGYNLPGRDWFHIRRIHGDPALARLKNWLSFDPRKLRLEPTVEYPQPDLPYSFSTFKLKPDTTPC
jgi:peptidoglycan/xylan/chitin deacetylase (PgdA/CDA1 family)